MVLNKKIIGLFEISLLIISGFAFSHLMSQTNELFSSYKSKESRLISFIREKALDYLSNGLVSAQSSSVQTCLLDNEGSYCQEYPSSVCNNECTESCFPGRRGDFSSCLIGTCYDTSLGLCNPGTPKATCENSGGAWYSQTPVQCNMGCCLISPDGSGGANQARLTTSQGCNYLRNTLGAQVEWDSETTGEIQCLSKATVKREGACVLEFIQEEGKYNCQFIDEVRCLNNGGTFYVDKLCTHPELNTVCEITQNTRCFDGKDGVYFVDTCENKANIYDSSKINNIEYWSNVVNPSQSCVLSSGSDDLANQRRCGNCNYLAGNICGSPQSGIDESPVYGQYVCGDLSCVDEDGNRREHGESWCAFDGQIGLDGESGTNNERAVDVPGSRHYKQLCYEGEIRLEPCNEYRNGVCVESDNNGFTNAQCRVNTGSLCMNYNENKEELSKCEESPDCYLKHVEIDRLKFDVCVPKYPSGFDLSSDDSREDYKSICGFATQSCTYYEKKGIDGKWSCKINCECKEAGFAEKMNNLCMSLGDCGSHVNLAGELGKGYSTSGDRIPKISQNYIEELRSYITPKEGQKVSGLTNSQLEVLFGRNFESMTFDEFAKTITIFGLGAAGAVALGWVGELSTITTTPGGWFSSGTTTNTPTTLGSFSNALNSAAVGAGIGYILGLAFGLEGDELTTAIVVGAGAGVGLFYGGFTFVADPITLIIVAVITIILSIAGIGKYRERKVEFTCLPWQAPSGGDNCSKCSELGVECTEYKCNSLGQSCELLNAETADEICVNINPNDVSQPIIRLNTTLKEGLTYQEFANGVQIKSTSGDGCIQEYSAVEFDIITDEASQCKISDERPENGYEEMEDNFFDSSGNNYVINHRENIGMASLDSLGASGLDPERRGEYNLYVLCEDKSGNSNDNSYNVRFCVSPANDVQPPVITGFVPESPGFVGINSEYKDIQFYTDEPATCRFSSLDVSYELMENDAVCNNDLSQSTLNGWLCMVRLSVTQDENNYYFRCADQPWIGVEVEENSISLEGRNTNSQSNLYVVRRTTTPLTISSIDPDDKTIFSAVEPAPVTMNLVTAGGIDNGKATCEYSFNGVNYIDFANTGLSNHRQLWTSLLSGSYDMRIKCTDRAGNIVEGSAQFTVEVDNQGPLITRIYNSGNKLNVITNEDSVCEYSYECSFAFESGTALSGAGRIHTMSYSNGMTYSIKCKDSFGNIGSCLSVTQGY